jgi:hypothetical protein
MSRELAQAHVEAPGQASGLMGFVEMWAIAGLN